MPDCWAAALQECKDGWSGEHLFSQGLFSGATVLASGFPWLKSARQLVPPASLKSNILCRHHNSALSLVDSESIQTFKALDEAQRLLDVRSGLSRTRYWNVQDTRISGDLLERWFVKTTINMVCAVGKGQRWALSGTPHDVPPIDLVQYAFGRTCVIPPLGLYLAAEVGDRFGPTQGVEFQPIAHRKKGIAGASFEFQGLRFLLWLVGEEPPSALDIAALIPKWGPIELLYRLTTMRYCVNGKLSHRIRIRWSAR